MADVKEENFAPLDMQAKYHTIQFWVQQDPPLNATALRVLAFLIQCQNPKTGRCDPLIQTIATKVRASERMVRRAVEVLVARGAIGKSRKSVRGRNKYWIPAKRLSKGSVKRKLASEKEDIAVSPERTENAAEKEKKENTKKRGTQNGWVQASQHASHCLEEGNIPDRMLYPKLQQKFENEVIRLGERQGITLEDLMDVPPGEFEALYKVAFYNDRKWNEQVIKAIKLCKQYRDHGFA